MMAGPGKKFQKGQTSPKKGWRSLSPEQMEEIIHRYKTTDVNMAELAREYHLHPTTLGRYFKERGIKPVYKRRAELRRGIYKRKLTPEQVEELRRLYWDEDLSQTDIAQRLGLTKGIVAYLFKRYGLGARNKSEYIKLRRRKEKEEAERAEAIKRYAPLSKKI